MPSIAGKSPVSDKLIKRGLAKATQAHAQDEVEYGSGGDLPPNISGIARLTFCGFGVYKTGTDAGESFLRISGSVVSPPEHVGKQVMVMEPLCDTKSWDKKTTTTFDEHVKVAMNLIRLVGGDTSNMRDQKDWEAVMKGLVDVGPYFHWHTWAGKPSKEYPNPKTKQFIDRVAENYTPSGEVAASAVEDNTGNGTEQSNGQAEASADEVDWYSLGAQATGGDADSEVPLKEKAEELGIDYENANTWEDVAKEIMEKLGSSAPEATSESNGEPWKPTKGETLSYKPRGPGKIADWTVTAVFKETCSLKRISDGKVLTGVKFSDNPPSLDGVELI